MSITVEVYSVENSLMLSVSVPSVYGIQARFIYLYIYIIYMYTHIYIQSVNERNRHIYNFFRFFRQLT